MKVVYRHKKTNSLFRKLFNTNNRDVYIPKMTYGKIYTVEDCPDSKCIVWHPLWKKYVEKECSDLKNKYWIKDDDGHIDPFDKSDFQKLEDYRNNKINKLLSNGILGF